MAYNFFLISLQKRYNLQLYWVLIINEPSSICFKVNKLIKVEFLGVVSHLSASLYFLTANTKIKKASSLRKPLNDY